MKQLVQFGDILWILAVIWTFHVFPASAPSYNTAAIGVRGRMAPEGLSSIVSLPVTAKRLSPQPRRKLHRHEKAVRKVATVTEAQISVEIGGFLSKKLKRKQQAFKIQEGNKRNKTTSWIGAATKIQIYEPERLLVDYADYPSATTHPPTTPPKKKAHKEHTLLSP